MTIKELKKLAESTEHVAPPAADRDRKYWSNLTYQKHPPIYGAGVSGSLTDPNVKEWNINKLGSILDIVKEEDNNTIYGVNTPFLYFGMWKTSFAWHTEDRIFTQSTYFILESRKLGICKQV